MRFKNYEDSPFNDQDRNALDHARVRVEVFDERMLVLDVTSPVDLDELFAKMPAVNKALRPVMILDRTAGDRALLRYPGALLTGGDEAGLPPLPSWFPDTGFRVGVPLLQDAGGRQWVPVLEEIKPENPADPRDREPFSVTSPSYRGLVALRINYPYQAAALSGFRRDPSDPIGRAQLPLEPIAARDGASPPIPTIRGRRPRGRPTRASGPTAAGTGSGGRWPSRASTTAKACGLTAKSSSPRASPVGKSLGRDVNSQIVRSTMRPAYAHSGGTSVVSTIVTALLVFFVCSAGVVATLWALGVDLASWKPKAGGPARPAGVPVPLTSRRLPAYHLLNRDDIINTETGEPLVIYLPPEQVAEGRLVADPTKFLGPRAAPGEGSGPGNHRGRPAAGGDAAGPGRGGAAGQGGSGPGGQPSARDLRPAGRRPRRSGRDLPAGETPRPHEHARGVGRPNPAAEPAGAGDRAGRPDRDPGHPASRAAAVGAAGPGARNRRGREPVPDITIALDPDEIGPVTAALAAKAEIVCVVHSGHPEAVPFVLRARPAASRAAFRRMELMQGGKRDIKAFELPPEPEYEIDGYPLPKRGRSSQPEPRLVRGPDDEPGLSPPGGWLGSSLRDPGR